MSFPSPESIASSNPNVWWAFVMHDVAGRVVIIAEDGTVLFANQETTLKYAFLPKPVVGASLFEDIATGDLGAEWRRLCGESIRSGVPSAVETMINGVRVRAVLRPLRHEGSNYLLIVSRDIAEIMSHEWKVPEGVRHLRGRVEDWGPLAGLTKREREILGLIGLGLSAAEIADRLGRSAKTVEWHRHQIGQKLKCKSRVELATVAFRAGLTPLHDLAGPQLGQRSDVGEGKSTNKGKGKRTMGDGDDPES